MVSLFKEFFSFSPLFFFVHVEEISRTLCFHDVSRHWLFCCVGGMNAITLTLRGRKTTGACMREIVYDTMLVVMGWVGESGVS